MVAGEPFDVGERGIRRLAGQRVARRGAPDKQHGHLAAVVEQATIDRLVPRRAPDSGVPVEQPLYEVLVERAVAIGGEQPIAQQCPDLGCGPRGIGHLVGGRSPRTDR